jgi:hypothetical protein
VTHLLKARIVKLTKIFFFNFECCILLRLTDSLWHRQSQQSFNILIIFIFTHYMFRTLRAILRWDIQLVIISDFEGLF